MQLKRSFLLCLLLFTTNISSFLLITVDVDDVKRIASQLVPEHVVQGLRSYMRKMENKNVENDNHFVSTMKKDNNKNNYWDSAKTLIDSLRYFTNKNNDRSSESIVKVKNNKHRNFDVDYYMDTHDYLRTKNDQKVKEQGKSKIIEEEIKNAENKYKKLHSHNRTRYGDNDNTSIKDASGNRDYKKREKNSKENNKYYGNRDSSEWSIRQKKKEDNDENYTYPSKNKQYRLKEVSTYNNKKLSSIKESNEMSAEKRNSKHSTRHIQSPTDFDFYENKRNKQKKGINNAKESYEDKYNSGTRLQNSQNFKQKESKTRNIVDQKFNINADGYINTEKRKLKSAKKEPEDDLYEINTHKEKKHRLYKDDKHKKSTGEREYFQYSSENRKQDITANNRDRKHRKVKKTIKQIIKEENNSDTDE